jgi:hypothetical protein
MPRFQPLGLVVSLTIGLIAGAATHSAACSSESETESGAAINAVAYAETVVRWHQIRKVSVAGRGNAVVFSKHDQAYEELETARNLLDAGNWQDAMKHAYRVPEILHY